jgi:O-antigen/teichoic acid export membrane protein
MRSDVGRSFAARALTLPVSALAGLINTAVLIEAVGGAQYGYVALIGTIFLLLPFADLGVGARVVNAFAAESREVALIVLTACIRILLVVGTSLVVVAALLNLSVAGTSLLGLPDSPDGRVSFITCMAIFALSLPLGLGQRVLLGLGRNSLVVGVSVTGPVATALACWLLTTAGLKSLLLSLVFPLGLAISSFITSLLAVRIAGLRWADLAGRLIRRRDPAMSVNIATTAMPMFVISIGLPIALHSDRLIIAHQATPLDLAAYSIAAQLYAPLWAIASTTGMPLWPMFARLRSEPEQAKRLWRKAQLGFLALSAGVGATLYFGGPTVARVVGDGEADTPAVLYLSFALLLVAQSTHLPNGMLLTDDSGLRFQAICVLVMVIANIGLSIFLTPTLGSAGPVIASAVAVLALQSLPAFGRVGLLSHRRRVAFPGVPVSRETS